MKIPRTKEDWKDAVLHQLWVKVSIVVLTAIIGFAVAQSRSVIKAETKAFVMDTVRPALDSIRQQMDTLKVNQDRLQKSINEAKAQQAQTKIVQEQFFGALMDAVPAIKKSVQERGKQTEAAEAKKAESKKLLQKLTGDK